MFVKNLFLSTLAVASLAAAQTSKCQDSYSVNSPSDLSNIANCESISGDVVIGKDMTTFSHTKLKSIGGKLDASGAASLTSLSLPVLGSIGGLFRLEGCTVLLSLSAPALTKVGQLYWVTLPALMTCDAPISQADTVTIGDTQLTSLGNINLKTVKEIDVNNNQYLKSVTMNLQSVSQGLSMGFNAKTIAYSFPDLIWSNNITLTGAGSINFPKLQHINGSMNFLNTSVTTISCNNLTAVEQTLAFIGNDKVTDLNFPVLKEIGGGFKIHNNSQLVNIDGFPKLEQVRGAIDFVGIFENASLPSLQDVQGGFNLQTTASFDCSEFNTYHDDKVIKGDSYTCKQKESNPTTADGTPGADGNKSSDKKGGAGRVGISALLGVSIAVVAFVF